MKSWILFLSLPAIFIMPSTTLVGSQDHRYPAPKRDLRLKLDVNLVTMRVVVTDGHGRPVTGLTRSDFRIREDKVEQSIVSFDTEEAPASIGLVLDLSDSMKRRFAAEREAAETLFNDSTEMDEYFVIAFGNRARLAQSLTTDISRLSASLTAMRPQGMTAMYDALYVAMEHAKSGHYGKKALLLITDGDDNRSRYSLTDLGESLKETDVQVYPVGILSGDAEAIADERDDLQELADLSGGDAFFPDSPRELGNICAKVAVELKDQYVIGYKSTNENKDGKWRNVRLRVRGRPGLKRLTVRSRSGYYAPWN